jgi:hypothetical protein
MKAKVKSTGKVITVKDYGKKFHPRYWAYGQGYDASELEFLGKKRTKLTTPARQRPGKREYLVRWEINLDATSPEQAAREALEIQRDPGSTATFFEVQNHKGKSCQIDIETL